MAAKTVTHELKIFYGKEVFPDREAACIFEQELDALLERYALFRWASGYDMIVGTRDISYDLNFMA